MLGEVKGHRSAQEDRLPDPPGMCPVWVIPPLLFNSFCFSFSAKLGVKLSLKAASQRVRSPIKVWDMQPDLWERTTEPCCNLLPTQPSNKKGRTGCDGFCVRSWERTGRGLINEFRLHQSNDLPAPWQHQFVLFSCSGVMGVGGWGIDDALKENSISLMELALANLTLISHFKWPS